MEINTGTMTTAPPPAPPTPPPPPLPPHQPVENDKIGKLRNMYILESIFVDCFIYYLLIDSGDRSKKAGWRLKRKGPGRKLCPYNGRTHPPPPQPPQPPIPEVRMAHFLGALLSAANTAIPAYNPYSGASWSGRGRGGQGYNY